LRFARSLGVEMVALSFATRAEDCAAIRAIAPDLIAIGKVESQAGVDQVPALAEAFDGLMVARGDLGVEMRFEEVPLAQRRILAECARQGKDSIVATHVLLSMRTNSRPSRAEVADVTAAVWDGAGALMLTGETGYGQHPALAVDVLRRIIELAEQQDPA